MSFYVKDFAVLPSYQRRGVGRRLMERMEAYVRGELKDGWAVSLELISAKGAEPFYEKLGFEPRPCEWDGAGMFKMLRRSAGCSPEPSRPAPVPAVPIQPPETAPGMI